MSSAHELAQTVRGAMQRNNEAYDWIRNAWAALAELERLAADAERYKDLLRRAFVLAKYGWDMQFYERHVDDEGFLSVEWLEDYDGEPLPPYVRAELEAG